MIIWGSKAKKSAGQSGTFFCPSCKHDCGYTAYKWQKYFTLYFIPLFPTELLSEHVECARCRGEFRPGILEHSREQMLAFLAPWRCTACNNVNSSEHLACLSCGSQRLGVASEAAV